jgi:hypothetical protein
MRRVSPLSLSILPLAFALGCSGTDSSTAPGAGGSAGQATTGGSSSAAGGGPITGGASNTGGSKASTGTSSIAGGPATGGAKSTGGANATGGNVSAGGAAQTGGAPGAGGSKSTGGAVSTGGLASTGGSKAAGGSSASAGALGTGGSNATGGLAATGGLSTTGGSKSTGGAAATGGSKSTGGAAATGGASSTGGSTGACSSDLSAPPSNVAAWINESWNDQLGNNVRTRKDWLLDSVMMGKGQINLCVRWGASTAPTAAVKTGMASAVQKWFNDWFTTLNYGGFPYCAGITTKVTGWAVKPGNTGWVSDLGSDVKIYTETDADGEPKCPDNCSFFNNWTHTFPNCVGGEAFHSDYWLWLDDSISGGATAVGGDWGLRIALSNFVASMGKSNLVFEHEMGHGFGFQDYYTWTGSTPAGGSLMIVGSTNSQVPTTGDQWLLRRTWVEMKALRGW